MITLVEVPKNQSPFFYAALEEWLVRNCDCANTDYLLLYVNDACAVVGKNQCVYKELNFNFWFHEPQKVVRRVSGGGTVFHDWGNLNFAFISKFEEMKMNNYAYFNEAIRIFLNEHGVPAVFNARNDMVAGGKKISGNAQFTNRKNILSHGTLLISADLKKLGAALKANSFNIKTKAVSSVRSSVENVSSFSTALREVHLVQEQLAAALCEKSFALNKLSLNEVALLQKEKYETYDWQFARSPDCLIACDDFECSISNGLFYAKSFANSAFSFIEKLNGCRFQKTEMATRLSKAEMELLLRAIT